MGQFVLIGVGAAVALLAGIGLGFWIGRTRQLRESAKAEEVQAEFDAYREKVSEHFGRTAGHFQTIGEHYRALYEHMATGAESLCDVKSSGQALSFAPAGVLASAPDALEGEAEESAVPVHDVAAAAVDAHDESGPRPGAEDSDAGRAEAAIPDAAEQDGDVLTAGEGKPSAASTDEVAAEETASDEDTADRIYH